MSFAFTPSGVHFLRIYSHPYGNAHIFSVLTQRISQLGTILDEKRVNDMTFELYFFPKIRRNGKNALNDLITLFFGQNNFWLHENFQLPNERAKSMSLR